MRGRRRGGRAGSLGALTVLARAPRAAGRIVAAAATATAASATSTTVIAVGMGAGGVPSRPLPGSANEGAISQPASTPTAAPASASVMFSESRTSATSLGVAPTAFSSPTRRVCSAIRPPTTTAMLAIASSARSQLPTRSAFWSIPMTL
jgi:hypothetical protein